METLEAVVADDDIVLVLPDYVQERLGVLVGLANEPREAGDDYLIVAAEYNLLQLGVPMLSHPWRSADALAAEAAYAAAISGQRTSLVEEWLAAVQSEFPDAPENQTTLQAYSLLLCSGAISAIIDRSTTLTDTLGEATCDLSDEAVEALSTRSELYYGAAAAVLLRNIPDGIE